MVYRSIAAKAKVATAVFELAKAKTKKGNNAKPEASPKTEDWMRAWA